MEKNENSSPPLLKICTEAPETQLQCPSPRVHRQPSIMVAGNTIPTSSPAHAMVVQNFFLIYSELTSILQGVIVFLFVILMRSCIAILSEILSILSEFYYK